MSYSSVKQTLSSQKYLFIGRSRAESNNHFWSVHLISAGSARQDCRNLVHVLWMFDLFGSVLLVDESS